MVPTTVFKANRKQMGPAATKTVNNKAAAYTVTWKYRRSGVADLAARQRRSRPSAAERRDGDSSVHPVKSVGDWKTSRR